MDKIKRIHFIDELRGFCVLCMVFFHGFFTVGYIFSVKAAQALFEFFTPVEPLFASAFIFISGISSLLSRSNLKRGLKLFFVALAFNLVTILFLDGCEIYFGILNLLSVCMLLYALTKKLIAKIPMWAGLITCGIMFFLTYPVCDGYLGIENLISYPLPQFLYETKFLFFLGFPNSDFFSADYFPLLPWLFMFFAGVFIGRKAKENKFPQFMYKSRIKFFSFLGKYALIIYIVHQPIIYGLTYLIYLLVK